MSSRLVELRVGECLDRFRVVGEIGRGGHGVVYEAFDTLLNRQVALKTIAMRGPVGTGVAPHWQEANLLSRVESPYVVAIYDLRHLHDAAVIVMEHVEGPTLETLILHSGHLRWQEVATLGIELALGLQALHTAGIVHGDIKPANLRLSRTRQLKILDMGVACCTRQPPHGLRPTWPESTFVGTVPYMSPEQLSGRRGDARSDIYAAGAVLFEMATGWRVFDGLAAGTRFDRLRRRVSYPPALSGDLPPWIERAILRALNPDADKRFQSAESFLRALSFRRVTHATATLACAERFDGERDIATRTSSPSEEMAVSRPDSSDIGRWPRVPGTTEGRPAWLPSGTLVASGPAVFGASISHEPCVFTGDAHEIDNSARPDVYDERKRGLVRR